MNFQRILAAAFNAIGADSDSLVIEGVTVAVHPDGFRVGSNHSKDVVICATADEAAAELLRRVEAP